MEDRKLIKSFLVEYPTKEIDAFIGYVEKLDSETDKDGAKVNKFMHFKKNSELAQMFAKVHTMGLQFDGKHVTILSTGVSFDYIAYKNRMLVVYPETLFDVQLVYKDDIFSFSKESGKVIYSHIVGSPFAQTDGNIIGGYCVIKNKRGEFLTTLSKEDIEKAKKVARTKTIWDAWFKAMCLKTIIKQAVKIHFDDIYQEIELEDNLQNDLSLAIPKNKLTLTQIREDVSKFNSIEEIRKYKEEKITISTPAISAVLNERVITINTPKTETA